MSPVQVPLTDFSCGAKAPRYFEFSYLSAVFIAENSTPRLRKRLLNKKKLEVDVLVSPIAIFLLFINYHFVSFGLVQS